MTTETPVKAPYPVDVFLNLLSSEQSTSALVICDQATKLPCGIPVHVGLFFDGTNNNMVPDRRYLNRVSAIPSSGAKRHEMAG